MSGELVKPLHPEAGNGPGKGRNNPVRGLQNRSPKQKAKIIMRKLALSIQRSIANNSGKITAAVVAAGTTVATNAQATFPDFTTSLDSVETLAIAAAGLGALIWLFLKSKKIAGKTVG